MACGCRSGSSLLTPYSTRWKTYGDGPTVPPQPPQDDNSRGGNGDDDLRLLAWLTLTALFLSGLALYFSRR